MSNLKALDGCGPEVPTRYLCLSGIFFLLLSASVSNAQTSHSAASYFNRAKERYARGDLDGAIADFDLAVTFDPRMALAYNNRGMARQDRGDLEGAIRDYTLALEINPRLAEAYSNRGVAHRAIGDLDGAIADYDACIKLNPRLPN